MGELRSQREDIKNRVKAAELNGETQTHHIEDWFAKVDTVEDKVSKILNDYGNGSSRWCINRRAKHSLADVTALAQNSSRIDVTTKLVPNGVQQIPGELPNLNNLDSHLSQLQTCLQEDGSGIIGIWGMGGVGKSTLLRGLNDKILRGLNNNRSGSSEAGQSTLMFDHVIWTVVSKDYKPLKLQRDIAKWLGLTLDNDELQQAMVINNFLKNKSFLLLLDDLWQQVDFAKLGIPEPIPSSAMKQKVVFTTRKEVVCAKMQAQYNIKIECLSEAEAWKFFKGKVGEETLQAHPVIPKLAREVARECDGLPLALAVIGSTMSTKTTPTQWQNAINLLQKRPHEIDGVDEQIFFKLKFSYDNLADEIFKKCFLLCSLWPEDSSISKVQLIEFWMGHGLINERNFDNINHAYDNGYSLISDLQAVCLLEQGDNKDREVKMHDVIRDLSLWIVSDCGEKPNRFTFLNNLNASENSEREVERISLISSDLSDTSFLSANYSKLETLMVQESNSFKSIMSGFFERTRALTYLDLSYTAICDLPEEISLLGNLRYLNLSHTNINSLPKQLGFLCQLRFLFLRGLGSISITHGVFAKLVMLSVIDMTDTLCHNWQELSKLSSGLKGVGIIFESIEDLHKLTQIHNVLIWRLGLRKLQGFKEPLQLLSPSLLGSRNIRSSIQMLKIESCESLERLSMESDGDQVIQKSDLLRLEKLELKRLVKLKEIVWRGVCPANTLPHLTVLTISFCYELSNISWVIRLPSLEDLTVQHCIQMLQIIDDDSDLAHQIINDDSEFAQAFPSLKRLRLTNLKSLIEFGGSFEFSSLELLHVIDCPKMNKLPFGAEMARKKLKEIRGAKEWWEKLNMEDDARDALLPYLK